MAHMQVPSVGLGRGLLGPLQQSGSLGGWERGSELDDLIAPALSLFSQSVTTLGFREAVHQEVHPIPPRRSQALTQGRGNVVTAALN